MPTTEITTAQDFIFDNMHIRIWLGEDGTIWYCAKDVAVALGYTNTSKAVKDHCKGVTKRYPLQAAGGTQTFTFIKRNDVYRLITSSKLPSAERFESWLFDEVVPSIHDHGAYIIPTAMQQLASNPDFVINLGMALKKAQEKQAVAEAKVKEFTNRVMAARSRIRRRCVSPRRDWMCCVVCFVSVALASSPDLPPGNSRISEQKEVSWNRTSNISHRWNRRTAWMPLSAI